MLYNVKTPSEYLDLLEDDWRKPTLLALREIILSQSDEIQESIQYKMLHYSFNDTSLFHLNAQKGYVSLYCGDTTKVDNSDKWLEGLDMGKGCIRFKKKNRVDETQIDEFIAGALEALKAGKDIGC
ncbi:MAG: DUF1801 domain-containing protein [Bacteroidota bacterium]